MNVEVNIEDLQELVYLAQLGMSDALRLYSGDAWDPRNSYHDYRKHLYELLALMSVKVQEPFID